MSDIEIEKYENETNASVPLISKKEVRVPGMRGEVSADFILPDYMGDIKKLLKYSATVTPCNKFVAGPEVSFLAIVTFRVMYLDSDNILTEASFTADYEESERFKEDFSDADVDIKVQNVTVRLGGPRKISAKAALISDMSLSGASVLCENSSYPEAERKEKKVKIHRAEYLKSAEREYAEEIERLEDTLSDEVEIVKYDAMAVIDAVHPTDRGVNLSGYIDAYCILRTTDDLMRLEKRIPVEEHIECDEMSEESIFLPKAYITGVGLNVNNVEGKDGEECAASVVMNMTLECNLSHHLNEEYNVITDAFIEGAENHCSYENVEYNQLVGGSSDIAKLSFSEPRGEDALHDIIDKEFICKNVKCEALDGEVYVSMDTVFNIVSRGSEEGDCISHKFEREFSEKYRISGVNENSKIRVSVTPCEFSPAFDAEKIYIDASLFINVIAEESKSETVLSKLDVVKKTNECERCVYVYYPEKDDTLWSVSKKYGVRIADVAKMNLSVNSADPEFDLTDTDKIIIVK